MILFLTQGREDDASSRVRIYNFFPYLTADGIPHDFIAYRYYRNQDIFSRSINFFSKRTFTIRVILNVLYYSFKSGVNQVVVQRLKINKGLFAVFKYFNVRMVFDADDGVFLDLNTMTIDKEYIEYLNKFDQAIFCSDLFNLDQVSIPSCIIPSCVKPPDKVKMSSSDDLIITWIGSPSTEKYLETLKESLIRILKANTNVYLHIMGAKYFKINSPNFKSLDWSLQAEQELLNKSMIGIMPLIKDNWTSFKCGYKLLLYMAFGKIAIGTSWGANSKIIENGKNGILVSDINEWENSLQYAIDNIDNLSIMVENARAKVIKYYSYKSNYSKWKHVILGK